MFLHHHSLCRASRSAWQLKHFIEGCCRPFSTVNFELLLLFLSGCMRARPCQRFGSNASLAGNCWCSRQLAVDSSSRCGRGWQLFNVAHFVTFWANWTRVDVDGGRGTGRAKGGCDFWQSTCNSHTHTHTQTHRACCTHVWAINLIPDRKGNS